MRDLIERLRTELAVNPSNDWTQFAHDVYNATAGLEAQAKRIELMEVDQGAYEERLAELEAENVQLCEIVEVHDDALKVFQAENERLREALEEIDNIGHEEERRIAIAAIKGDSDESD